MSDAIFVTNGRFDKAVEAAVTALWSTFASLFPEAQSGDLPPEAEHEFDKAVREAVCVWLQLNAPLHTFLPEGAQYTFQSQHVPPYEGETLDMQKFFTENAMSFTHDDLKAIFELQAGQGINFGGGAAPIFTLRRTA